MGEGGPDPWAEAREEWKQRELKETLGGTTVNDEGGSWIRTGGVDGYGYFDLSRIQKLCWWYYRNNPFAKNVLENYTYLTVGEGFTPEFDSTTMQKAWDKEVAPKIKWQQKHRIWVRNTYAWGEYFLTTYPKRSTWNSKQPVAKQLVRGIDPWNIFEVKTKPGDPETITGYAQTNKKVMNPLDVIHLRINYMGNYNRGLPVLLPVLDGLYYAEKFLGNRHWINHIRARIPAVRKVLGGARDVANEKTRLQNLPKPGTYAVENQGTEWQYPDYNIRAGDAKDDYRNFVLVIASGTNLPEFLVHSTAENSAYASLLAQESPTVRMFMAYQQLFATYFSELIAQLMGTTDFTIKVPPVVPRDVDSVAKAFAMAVDKGACSLQTFAEKLGLKWKGKDGELERMRQEGTASGFGTVPDDNWEEELIYKLEVDQDFRERLTALVKPNGKAEKELNRLGVKV
jgi:hypothetical protein